MFLIAPMKHMSLLLVVYVAVKETALPSLFRQETIRKKLFITVL